MKLINRVGFYIGGFSIGLIFLAFILKGKKTKFSYWPNDRIINDINKKKIIFSRRSIDKLLSFDLDSSEFNIILKDGKVIGRYKKSNLDNCKTYTIKSKKLIFEVENCTTTAILKNISNIVD